MSDAPRHDVTPRPYSDSVAHLRAELDRLDILLRHRVETWWAETEAVHDQFQALYVSDEEIDALLDLTVEGDETDPSTASSALLDALERASADLDRRTRQSPLSGETLRFRTLGERFGLDRTERDLLLIALAPEVDRKYERIYGYLQDDITKTRPTVEFALSLLAVSQGDTDPLRSRHLFGGESRLVRNRLVTLDSTDDVSLPSRTLRVDDRVRDFLFGSDAVDARLDAVEVRTPTGTLSALVVEDAPRQRLARLATILTGEETDSPLAVALVGPEGVGRAAAVEALCGECETLLVADVRRTDSVDTEWVTRLVREARVRDAPLLVRGLTEETEGLAALCRGLDVAEGPVFLSTTAPVPARTRAVFDSHDLVTVALPTPGYAVQRRYWETFDLPDAVDTARLASTFSLTPGQIDAAVREARHEARVTETHLSTADLARWCRDQTTVLLGTLARAVTPTYGWDDIVLPADRRTHLREVAAHVKHRGTVYTEWGFAGKFSLGNGLVVLFTGPSGTGKTMAAEIIAGDAGLDLYKIDLSSVVSKYIGETEKNLSRVFDEAEGGNVVLLFDEADALFGKRSEVSDAHDRYANIEVNYLLQRIEEHDGTVILTTNFKRNIDDAFLRRIHLSVDFPMPDERSRAAIWKGIFPPETPVRDLDVPFLARFEVSGGNIKNVALTAAFLAADADDVVGMEHVVRALGRELQKMGRVVRPDEFGRYQGYLSA